MSYAIEVKNLSKNYKDFQLENISLNIETGSIFGLIGENGAGKSTFINALLGVIQSNYETLKIFGLDLKNHEKQIKEDVAVIFDTTHYNLAFTPKFIGTIMKNTYKRWDMNVYYQYLDKFHLPLNKKLKHFSKGMKMKLEFAIAFSHDAKLLILDEATSGLDPVFRDEILDMIREFTEDESHTVLMSSHITSDLDKVADYIGFVRNGHLEFVKSHEDINEEYGIIHCGKEFIDSLDQDSMITYIKEPYSYKVLVNDRLSIQKIFPDLEITRPSIEDIMLFYIKDKLLDVNN